jgi:A/G-specific adenine glycosylase
VARKQRAPRDVMPAPPARRSFRRTLLTWYDANGRSLPWRETSDPYHILVSEIMLQQTQVDRVLPKYHEWLEKYPSFESLAAAPEADVTAAWYPLGYNIRPRRLQAIAREAVASYGGRLPADESTLLSFKGIAPPFSTRTWRECCSACSSAAARPKPMPRRSTCGRFPRPCCRAPAPLISTRH